jgi:hypothetical protein
VYCDDATNDDATNDDATNDDATNDEEERRGWSRLSC